LIRLYAAAGTCPACLQRGPPPQRLTNRGFVRLGIHSTEFDLALEFIRQFRGSIVHELAWTASGIIKIQNKEGLSFKADKIFVSVISRGSMD
jgi:hypothetical protein